ncbi:MAG TPA: dTDP-4-dehydrorhamnose 3,5-epimerase family protein [Pirellulales bacterium]|jgi:dTDP-4-dehydrorhamnose 3,5-epimerase|nr:dTDP-4-dehydrorhamnose 3,5-epimerase family protein [Pirellulales bacterium]
MFETGTIEGVVFKALRRFSDARGWLVELFRDDELAPGDRPLMGYVSETLPGVVRGPHEHVEQSDYFAFLGPGDFKLYLWDARPASSTFRRRQTLVVGESNRQAVLVPPGVVHAYQCIGERPGWVINCPNRLYAGEGRKDPVDEIRHEDDADSEFVLD